MTDPTPSLLPCPFCGAGETQVIPKSHWGGMSSHLLSVTVRHWCERAPSGLSGGHIDRVGKTHEEAIAQWNHRKT